MTVDLVQFRWVHVLVKSKLILRNLKIKCQTWHALQNALKRQTDVRSTLYAARNTKWHATCPALYMRDSGNIHLKECVCSAHSRRCSAKCCNRVATQAIHLEYWCRRREREVFSVKDPNRVHHGMECILSLSIRVGFLAKPRPGQAEPGEVELDKTEQGKNSLGSVYDQNTYSPVNR